MKFVVKNILSGDSVEVVPSWKWNEQTNNKVIIKGYSVPDEEESGINRG